MQQSNKGQHKAKVASSEEGDTPSRVQTDVQISSNHLERVRSSAERLTADGRG